MCRGLERVPGNSRTGKDGKSVHIINQRWVIFLFFLRFFSRDSFFQRVSDDTGHVGKIALTLFREKIWRWDISNKRTSKTSAKPLSTPEILP